MNENTIGDITTIGKIIAMPLAGWAIGFLASKGLNLPIGQQTLSEWIFIMILFVWGLLDAKYPNALKIFKNAWWKVKTSSEETISDNGNEGDSDGC